MTFRLPAPDGSRDQRIEDPTNRWVVHVLSRALLPVALRAGISANSVSIAGLIVGAASAACFFQWRNPAAVWAALALAAAWLVLDGLDGMVARATSSASPIGRIMDGLCDHGVFFLIYLALGFSLGTREAWVLCILAGLTHAAQSSLYEGERARFHRRLKGVPPPAPATAERSWLVRGYDAIASLPDRFGIPLERQLQDAPDAPRRREGYGAAAARPLKFMWVLSGNMRVMLIAASCLLGDPRLFFWLELVGLSAIAVIGIGWHKALEVQLATKWTDSSHMVNDGRLRNRIETPKTR